MMANRYLILRTVIDGLVLWFTGLQVSQRGPSFLDLQQISRTTLEGASSYVTASQFGFIAGNLIAGVLKDRLTNTILLVCIPLTLSSVFQGVIPLCTSYTPMLVFHILSFFAQAFLEITITAEQVHLWYGKSDSAMQWLSFMYSFGGFISPLYTEPFLSPKVHDVALNDSNTVVRDGISTTIDPSFERHVMNYSIIQDRLDGQPANLSTINTTTPTWSVSFVEKQGKSQLLYAYLITAIIGVVISIPIYVMCFRKCFHNRRTERSGEEKQTISLNHIPSKVYVLIVFFSSFLYLFYCLTEDSFNVMLSMFVVSYLSWSKDNGAFLTSLYWALGAGTKLVMIPVANKLDTGIVLLVSTVGMVVSLLLFLIACHFHLHVLIWVSVSSLAVTGAPVFGGGFSWVDSNLMELDGKATSWMFVLSSVGTMVGPLGLGFTMGRISMMVFPYLALIEALFTMAIFMAMMFLIQPWVVKKYGRPRSKCIAEEEIRVDVKEEGQENEEDEGEDKWGPEMQMIPNGKVNKRNVQNGNVSEECV